MHRNQRIPVPTRLNARRGKEVAENIEIRTLKKVKSVTEGDGNI